MWFQLQFFAWKNRLLNNNQAQKQYKNEAGALWIKLLLNYPKISSSKPSPSDSPPRLTHEDSPPLSSPSSEEIRSPMSKRSLMNRGDAIDVEDINSNKGFVGEVM